MLYIICNMFLPAKIVLLCQYDFAAYGISTTDKCNCVQQFWASESQPYQFVPVKTFSDAFKTTELGKAWDVDLDTPFQRPADFPDELDPLQRSRSAFRAA